MGILKSHSARERTFVLVAVSYVLTVLTAACSATSPYFPSAWKQVTYRGVAIGVPESFPLQGIWGWVCGPDKFGVVVGPPSPRAREVQCPIAGLEPRSTQVLIAPPHDIAQSGEEAPNFGCVNRDLHGLSACVVIQETSALTGIPVGLPAEVAEREAIIDACRSYTQELSWAGNQGRAIVDSMCHGVPAYWQPPPGSTNPLNPLPQPPPFPLVDLKVTTANVMITSHNVEILITCPGTLARTRSIIDKFLDTIHPAS